MFFNNLQFAFNHYGVNFKFCKSLPCSTQAYLMSGEFFRLAKTTIPLDVIALACYTSKVAQGRACSMQKLGDWNFLILDVKERTLNVVIS